MDEKLKGADYIQYSYLELVSHPDFDYKVWLKMMFIYDMTTEDLNKINLIGVINA